MPEALYKGKSPGLKLGRGEGGDGMRSERRHVSDKQGQIWATQP